MSMNKAKFDTMNYDKPTLTQLAGISPLSI